MNNYSLEEIKSPFQNKVISNAIIKVSNKHQDKNLKLNYFSNNQDLQMSPNSNYNFINSSKSLKNSKVKR